MYENMSAQIKERARDVCVTAVQVPLHVAVCLKTESARVCDSSQQKLTQNKHVTVINLDRLNAAASSNLLLMIQLIYN